MLRALILAFHDDAARHVGDAHGGVGLIDVLATSARGPVGVHAQIRRIDVNVLDLLELRQDRNGAGGGVDAALRFGRGDPLYTMRAGLKLVARKDPAAGDAADDLLIAAVLARAFAHDFDGESLGFGVARVHAQEVARKQRRLVAPGPGAHFEKDVVLVARIRRDEHLQQRRLRCHEPLSCGEDFLRCKRAHGSIRIRQQLLGRRERALLIPKAAIALRERLQPRVFHGEVPELRRAPGYFRRGEQPPDLLEAIGHPFDAVPYRVLHVYRAAVRAMRGMARHFIVSSMNRHGISVTGAVAAVAVVVTASCSAARTTQTAPEHPQDPNTLTLLAELALEHGDCRLAAENYAAAARQNAVAIARRASEVGLACENLPAAWQSVQRWRALAPADVDAATTYAAIAIKLYKLPAARAGVQTVIKAAGANTDARIGQLATALLEEAEAPAVLDVISGAVGTQPSAKTLALLAQLSLEAFDPQRAERYARQALEREPSLTAAKQILARVYVMQADVPQAITTAREVMASDPKNFTFELAEVLVALDRREEARQELERVRAAGTASAEVDQRLAVLAFQDGDLAEAQRRFADLAARGEIGEGVVLYLADIAARDGDQAAAIAGYRQLENSALAITARTRAAAILLPEHRAAAFALLDDYAVAHPEQSFELTLTKVHLLADHGEIDAALALIQAALERHPSHPALEYERAVLLERAGDVHGSVAALDRLLSARGDDPTLLNALGYTLADHGVELPRAEKLIRRALVISPDNPAVLDSLGWVRFKRGDGHGAAPILAHAYALGRDSDIAAHFGEALWHNGDETQARNVWAAALARDPASPLVKSTMTRLLPPEKS